MWVSVSLNRASQTGSVRSPWATPAGIEFGSRSPASSMDPKELARLLDSSVPMERQQAAENLVRIVGGIDALAHVANKLKYADTKSQALIALVSDLNTMISRPLSSYPITIRRVASRIAFDVKALVHVVEHSKYADTRFQAADELEKVAPKLTNPASWTSVAKRLKDAAKESIAAAITSQAEKAPAGK